MNPFCVLPVSGGEGCCQSFAGSAFGLGSDIGGSIRMPAFFNGIFGHKGTTGITHSVCFRILVSHGLIVS